LSKVEHFHVKVFQLGTHPNKLARTIQHVLSKLIEVDLMYMVLVAVGRPYSKIQATQLPEIGFGNQTKDELQLFVEHKADLERVEVGLRVEHLAQRKPVGLWANATDIERQQVRVSEKDGKDLQNGYVAFLVRSVGRVQTIRRESQMFQGGQLVGE
jgi:hypothetical protein